LFSAPNPTNNIQKKKAVSRQQVSYRPSSGGHWCTGVKLWVDSTTRQYTRLSICPTKLTQLLLFMLRREWKDLQTEDWKPELKQAGR